MLGGIGVLALIIQLCMAAWENKVTGAWKGIRSPTALWQILIEWAMYMLMFIVLSVLLQVVLRFTCVIC